MALFQTAALRKLNALYRFIGGRIAPERVELSMPVQTVHDVSRMVELGTIQTDRLAGSLFTLTQTNTHAGAGTEENTLDAYDDIAASGWGRVNERWIWLLNSFLTADGSILSSASLSLGIPNLGNAMVQRDVMLAVWGAVTAFHDVEGTGFSIGGVLDANRQFESVTRPILIPPGSAGLGLRTVSTGAGDFRYTGVCMVLPAGVYPPCL